MADKQTLTLVFEIQDNDAFQKAYSEFRLGSRDEVAPYRVTGFSIGDELRRTHLLNEILERVDDLYDLKEMVGKALSLYEPAEFDAFEKEFNQDYPDPFAKEVKEVKEATAA